jgi:hypothetical protein
MAEQKKQSPSRKETPKQASKPQNKYAPTQKIRPTIGASRVGQPNAGRVTAANLNTVKITVH